MIEADYQPFVDAPVGRFTVLKASLVWCASPGLCGAVFWGHHDEEEARKILHICDQYERHMGATFNIILDTRGVEVVEPHNLQLLFSWLLERQDRMFPRIHLQASVIREGPIGFLLAGLLPVVGKTHPYRIFTDPLAAFHVAGASPELCAEVETLSTRLQGIPQELRFLRAYLESNPHTSIEEACSRVGTSTRSLQRLLARQGTSFHQEASRARLSLAQELLRASDLKLLAVSARVGLSERALTLLFRSQTGLSPAGWRKQNRSR